jgi:hypothetical protein
VINEVSRKDQGIDPKQGITKSLEKFLDQISIARKYEAKKKRDEKLEKRGLVLNRYELIAERYSAILKDDVEGDKLIKMMCFRAGKEFAGVKVDLSFYLEVQKEIFRILLDVNGVPLNSKQIVEAPKRSLRRSARNVAKSGVPIADLGPVTKGYFNFSKSVPGIVDLAKKCLQNPKDFVLKKKLESLIKAEVKKKKKKIPQKVDLIASHLLKFIDETNKK